MKLALELQHLAAIFTQAKRAILLASALKPSLKYALPVTSLSLNYTCPLQASEDRCLQHT
eukprot:3167686-Amphidinium_carterae.1